MNVAYPNNGISRFVIPSRTSIAVSGLGRQHEKSPLDFEFKTELVLVSLKAGYGYSVEDKNNIVTHIGDFISSPQVFLGTKSFSVLDEVSVSYIKYGFLFRKSIFILTPSQTLMFMAHSVNSDITLSEASASALSGITINKAAKTISVTSAHSNFDLYDYLQFFQSQPSNVDLLKFGEIFRAVSSANYKLLNTWTLKINSQIMNGLTVDGNVELVGVVNLVDHKIAGKLIFTTAGTYTLTNCTINEVINTSAGNVIINVTGVTSITTNTGPNITINNTKVFTVIGLIAGSIVEIYDNEIVNIGNNDTLLASTQNSGTSFAYTHNGATNAIRVQVLKTGYIEEIHDFSLSNVDQSLSIKQGVDLND